MVADFKDNFEQIKPLMDPTLATKIDGLITTAEGTATFANADKIKAAFVAPAKDDKITVKEETKNASTAISSIDKALETIASNRATLGATLNRLDFNVNNLKSQSSSMASAASSNRRR